MKQVLPVLVMLATVSPLEKKMHFPSSQIHCTVHLKIFSKQEKCFLTLRVVYTVNQCLTDFSEQEGPWFIKSTNEWRVTIDFEREGAEKETGSDEKEQRKKECEKKFQEREAEKKKKAEEREKRH